MHVPPTGRFRGRFTLTGDKSISHRLAILGALAEGDTHIENYSPAADCASTLRCLSQLGVGIDKDPNGLTIRGGPWRAPQGILDAGNSGSTLRMLMGALAPHPFEATLDGDVSLRRRPAERVAGPLRRMGATVETVGGTAPVRVRGGALRAIDEDLPVASAQVKTAILLAGLRAAGTTSVGEPSPSRDHTERWLPAFGAAVGRDRLKTSVAGGQRLHGIDAAVPGDPSSAAFLLVAGTLLPDSEVRCDRLCLNPTRIAFVEILRAMGAAVTIEPHSSDPEPTGSLVARTSALHGVSVEAHQIPALIDEVPILAVAAARAEGETVFHGVGELRVKESDRIKALVEGLGAMGADIEASTDTLTIRGGRPLRAAALRTHGDHRIAMALAVAALGAKRPSTLDDGECVAVSFPDFWQILKQGAA